MALTTGADKLSFWGFTIDSRLQSIDFGAVPRRSSGDVRLRVKNESMAYIARNVTVTAQGGLGPASHFYFSVDGSTFTASAALGDLWPSAFSTTFWIRRTTPDGYPATTRNTYLKVTATSWTHTT